MVQAGRPHYTPQHKMGAAHIVQNPMEEHDVMDVHGYYSDGVQIDADPLLSNRCGYLLHMVVVFHDYLLYTDDLMAMHRPVPDH
jgi:hypothetical protein